MSNEAPTSVELLEELRISQAAVATEVATFGISLVPLGEALTEIANALARCASARAEIVVERTTALNAIQTKLQVALAAIAAASQTTQPSDPFTESRRIGGPQVP